MRGASKRKRGPAPGGASSVVNREVSNAAAAGGVCESRDVAGLDHEIFTTEIAAAAARDRLRTVAIDGEREADATAAAIADQFGL